MRHFVIQVAQGDQKFETLWLRLCAPINCAVGKFVGRTWNHISALWYLCSAAKWWSVCDVCGCVCLECGIGARGEPEGAITREVNHQAECWPGTLLTLPEPTRNLSFTLSVCGGLSSPILGRQHSKNHSPPLKTILTLSTTAICEFGAHHALAHGSENDSQLKLRYFFRTENFKRNWGQHFFNQALSKC